ncbi:DNA-3-methyladenine glycosylase 2 family protein [Pseudoalteromonas luteoviolacea]|uniref:DNA-3-methyladenine glycosylase 2 family protein n=1 Tax=Pseudoalteromonas luteoviolacea TaxID=43657 RepID=UPI001B37EEF2|nr:AlkA N-terminal domain-containing protein [Pseudoalteromonas luteoviolacea]MBQ4812235.1 DNA-3-methyladenine glycosylase 2 family protein [Pseudoalteromonas luteoviolacea]
MLDHQVCQKARLSRDARFDGKFFIAVKTTGIYCRTVCPAHPPKEENVEYFQSAMLAAQSGYRPCLRCRPDSAPDSPAWKGVGATLDRAIKLIDQGALQQNSLPELASRLGVSDRYLRKLFNQHLGVSPKTYALYQQCLFAKKLLHQTSLPITEVALASGFESVRRFNDCFKDQLKLTPTQMRKQREEASSKVVLRLFYRPPFNWQQMQQFLSARLIEGLEWITPHSYGRYFSWQGHQGLFNATHLEDKHCFEVEIQLDELKVLKPVVNNIRRILDLDADLVQIEQDLALALPRAFKLTQGLRLPGIWSLFEAGIRAILGQQVSVQAAKNLVHQLVHQLGEKAPEGRYFPAPSAIANSDLQFLKMPDSRRQTLIRFAQYFCDTNEPEVPDDWLQLKGIGPWTVAYAKMRGQSDPDIFLGSDLGVIKALKAQTAAPESTIAVSPEASPEPSPEPIPTLTPDLASPWRSYLTFQLWSQL